jgi:hypothetical protein
MKGERFLLLFNSVSRDGGEAGPALYSLYILEKRRSRNMSCCHKGLGFWRCTSCKEEKEALLDMEIVFRSLGAETRHRQRPGTFWKSGKGAHCSFSVSFGF